MLDYGKKYKTKYLKYIYIHTLYIYWIISKIYCSSLINHIFLDNSLNNLK